MPINLPRLKIEPSLPIPPERGAASPYLETPSAGGSSPGPSPLLPGPASKGPPQTINGNSFPFPALPHRPSPRRSSKGFRLFNSALPRSLAKSCYPSPRRLFVLGLFLLGLGGLIFIRDFDRSRLTAYFPSTSIPPTSSASVPKPRPKPFINPNDFRAVLPSLPRTYIDHFSDLSLPEPVLYYPLLAERLDSFLRRPVLSHDEAKSLGDNDRGCPERVAGQLHANAGGNEDFWKELGSDEIIKRRAGVVRWLEDWIVRGEQVIGSLEGGRGIVMTGGNHDTSHRLISVLRHLKRIGNTMPIEVFHYPGELEDQSQRNDIEQLGGTIREIRGVEKNDSEWKVSTRLEGRECAHVSRTGRSKDYH
jgi:hypothetical protein